MEWPGKGCTTIVCWFIFSSGIITRWGVSFPVKIDWAWTACTTIGPTSSPICTSSTPIATGCIGWTTSIAMGIFILDVAELIACKVLCGDNGPFNIYI